MVTLNLDKIFNPQNVAIIGASEVEGSVGYAIAKNFTQLGYVGKVYFVNIRTEILGVKTYKTVDQIPEPVDLAIIATPAKTAPEVMEECGRAHVKGVLDLKNMDMDSRCLRPKISPKVAAEKIQVAQASEENKSEAHEQPKAR
ncbi:MAG: CoA-binding protein [Candidatus Bathyarchaeia archaeon]|jgi:predicted CoA-binding protein